MLGRCHSLLHMDREIEDPLPALTHALGLVGAFKLIRRQCEVLKVYRHEQHADHFSRRVTLALAHAAHDYQDVDC